MDKKDIKFIKLFLIMITILLLTLNIISFVDFKISLEVASKNILNTATNKNW